MVESRNFKDFLIQSINKYDTDEKTKKMVAEASLYSAIMMEKAINFLAETHSITEEIYLSNLMALMLATSEDMDSAIRCSKILTERLIKVDKRYNKFDG